VAFFPVAVLLSVLTKLNALYSLSTCQNEKKLLGMFEEF